MSKEKRECVKCRCTPLNVLYRACGCDSHPEQLKPSIGNNSPLRRHGNGSLPSSDVTIVQEPGKTKFVAGIPDPPPTASDDGSCRNCGSNSWLTDTCCAKCGVWNSGRSTQSPVLAWDALLPTTFYAGLPFEQRLQFLVKQWNRLIKVNQELENENTQLYEELMQFTRP